LPLSKCRQLAGINPAQSTEMGVDGRDKRTRRKKKKIFAIKETQIRRRWLVGWENIASVRRKNCKSREIKVTPESLEGVGEGRGKDNLIPTRGKDMRSGDVSQTYRSGGQERRS